MKKRTSYKTLLVIAIIALAVSWTLTLSRPVELRVDGEPVATDVSPVRHDNEVFVPVRALSDALGADMKVDDATGTIEIVRNDQHLTLKLGSTQAKLNGAKMTLAHAPFRVRGRVMVGLHAVSRAFNLKTRYDARTARIDVDTSGVIEEGAIQDTSP